MDKIITFSIETKLNDLNVTQAKGHKEMKLINGCV